MKTTTSLQTYIAMAANHYSKCKAVKRPKFLTAECKVAFARCAEKGYYIENGNMYGVMLNGFYNKIQKVKLC